MKNRIYIKKRVKRCKVIREGNRIKIIEVED